MIRSTYWCFFAWFIGFLGAPLTCGDFVLKGTEIHDGLGTRSLVVVEDRIFMLDPGGRLLTFDGDRARQIAGKGEGPGELDRPTEVTLLDERLYIRDRGKIHEFDTRGRFLRSHIRLAGNDFVGRATNGFLYLDGLGHGQRAKPMALILVLDSGTRKHVSSWQSEAIRNPRSRWRAGYLSMALERSRARIDLEGKYVYTQVAGLDEVHITEIESGKNVNIIEVIGEPRPYEKEEGQKYLARMKRKHGMDLKGDFPDHYPLISQIAVSHEGHLLVLKSAATPIVEKDRILLEPDHLMVFDTVGNPLTPNKFDLGFWRVAWLDEEWVYVLAYNEPFDEHTVVRCARSDFHSVIAKYPVSYHHTE